VSNRGAETVDGAGLCVLASPGTVLFFIGEYRIADNTRSHFYAAGFTSR